MYNNKMTRISSWFFIIVYLLYVLTLGVQMNDVSHLTNPPTLRCDFGYSDTNLQCLLHEIEFSVYPNVNHNLMSVCNILMIEFSDKVSDFMGCAVINARPFGMCESCVSFYNNMTDVYQRILSTADNDTTSCEERLLNSDKIQIIRQLYDAAVQLWTTSHCSVCFTPAFNSQGLVTYTLSNETLMFNEYMNTTLECIRNATNDTFSLQTCIACVDTEVCDLCVMHYKQLNKFYESLVVSTSADCFCMDVVDKMNMTRMLWSKTLLCVHHKNPVLLLFLCSSSIAMFTAGFYITVWYRSERQEQDIVPQKRLLQRQEALASCSS